MKAVQRALGVFLLSIMLYGCQQFNSQPNLPSQFLPTPGLTQTMAPVSSETVLITSPTLQAEQRTATTTPQPTDDIRSITILTPGACQLEPVTQPPWPDKTFMPNELDRETGLHITGHPQQINLDSYRLEVTGLVDHPLSLTYDELRCMPSVTDNPDLVCPGVFTDYATWTGVPIGYILDLAGIQEDATELTLVSADGYQVNLPLETASKAANFLAYELNGKPLPVQHGFPLRAVFPDMWGSYWLKWLVEIRLS